MSIFVHMTAYRGFDVVPTVRDCIEKSKDRDGLHFGIVLQQDDAIPPELVHPRILAERVPVSESPGHGWARNKAQAMYAGQDFCLQIESGCRFAEGWDEQLIQALNIIGSERSIVTNPANKFNTENGELEHKDTAYKTQLFQFISETPSSWPVALKGAVAMQRARMTSDHYIFSQGRHCTECVHDPNLYYSEIDSAFTLRSFTFGYDIFHHFRPMVFRNYSPRPMNWQDDSDWWLKDRASKKRFSQLAAGELSEFGIGSARSTRDFELYSGIDFVGRRLQRDALGGSEPPCKFENEDKWQDGYMKDRLISVSWDPAKVEPCDDYDYWLFAIEDSSGNVIIRQDLRWERDKDALEKRVSSRKIQIRSQAKVLPSKLAIQPFSKSRGALAKVTFDI
jgi:hypothetical protein